MNTFLLILISSLGSPYFQIRETSQLSLSVLTQYIDIYDELNEGCVSKDPEIRHRCRAMIEYAARRRVLAFLDNNVIVYGTGFSYRLEQNPEWTALYKRDPLIQSVIVKDNRIIARYTNIATPKSKFVYVHQLIYDKQWIAAPSNIGPVTSFGYYVYRPWNEILLQLEIQSNIPVISLCLTNSMYVR